MAIMKVTLPGNEITVTGKLVSFTAPCDCEDAESLQIDGVTYSVVDAVGKTVTGSPGRWTEGSIITVILDTESNNAYLMNGNLTPANIGAAALDANFKVTAENTSAFIVSVAGNTTLELAHAGCFVSVNSSSALTITIPNNSSAAFPYGTEIEIFREGTGDVLIAAASGVTILCKEANYSIVDQYTSAVLKKLDTDTWSLQGNVG